LQGASEPERELHRERRVEAEVLPERLDLLGAGVLAQEDADRVTRGEARDQEDETATTA
jgi:hypothetical protein